MERRITRGDEEIERINRGGDDKGGQRGNGEND